MPRIPVQVRIDIENWMESALQLIDFLREENYRLRAQVLELKEKVQQREILKEVIKEVRVITTEPIKVPNSKGLCKCGRMEVAKFQSFCAICYGERRRAAQDRDRDKRKLKQG